MAVQTLERLHPAANGSAVGIIAENRLRKSFRSQLARLVAGPADFVQSLRSDPGDFLRQKRRCEDNRRQVVERLFTRIRQSVQ